MVGRRPLKAGTWYEKEEQILRQQLETWLDQVTHSVDADLRAIIAPHAGYSYSGPVAAHAYKHVKPHRIKRIFLLGPSHHVPMPDCALTQVHVYHTPLGDLPIDKEVNEALSKTGLFSYMSLDDDENEHSLELHLPYIRHIMKQKTDVLLVPIMVGHLSRKMQACVGSVLAPFLESEDNFFVISSDFCHWGSRFSYTFYDETHGAIHKSIEAIDRTGMSIIESGCPHAFATYLKETRNTICGRMPISVLLEAMSRTQLRLSCKFTHYAQSNKCISRRDSSVSYAAAIIGEF